MIEERTIILEQHAKGTDVTLVRVEGKIDNIANTLNTLVRVEERQLALNDRMTESGIATQALADRLVVVETALPGLLEKSKWLVTGVLGIVSLAALKLIEAVTK